MNQLAKYDSDSEEDGSSSVNSIRDNLVNTNEKEDVARNPELSPSMFSRKRNAREQSHGLVGGADYFNLNCSSEDDEEVITNIHGTSKIHVEKEEHLPVLSFWNDNKQIPHIQNHSCTDTALKVKNVTSSAHCTRDVSEAMGDSSIIKSYVSKKNKYVTATQSKELPRLTSQQTLRSCYQIHAKVAPVLNRERVCFSIPKTVTRALNGHVGAINRIEWCVPQFSHIIASASMDRKVKLWNIFQEDKNCIKSYVHHTKAVTDVAWSATGKNLLTCSYDKTASVTDVETGTSLAVCEHQNFVSVGRYHPVNFHYFVTGTLDNLCCWDMRNTERPAKVYVYKDKFGQVKDLAFSKDGSQFFTCNDQVRRDSADKNIMAWDFNKHVVISNQIYQERFTCTRLKVHPFKEEFLAQSQGGYIAQFSTQRPYKMNRCKRFESQKVMGYNIGFDVSLDGKYIVSGSADGNVHFYNYNNAKSVQKLKLGERTVCLDVACHPVFNSTVAVSTWDGDIKILK